MIKHRQVQRRGRRSQMTTRYGGTGMGTGRREDRVRTGRGRGFHAPLLDPSTRSFTDPSVSMDLLRAVLQPSINEEIRGIFNKYMKVGAGDRWAAAGARGQLGCHQGHRAPLWELGRHCAGCHPLLPRPLQFFQTAAINVRDNVGEEVDPEQLIQETCRSCLEQVGAGEVLLGCPAKQSSLVRMCPS